MPDVVDKPAVSVGGEGEVTVWQTGEFGETYYNVAELFSFQQNIQKPVFPGRFYASVLIHRRAFTDRFPPARTVNIRFHIGDQHLFIRIPRSLRRFTAALPTPGITVISVWN